MKTKKIGVWSWLRWMLITGLVVVFAIYLVGCMVIGFEVREVCAYATERYKGGCWEAVLTLVASNDEQIRMRNRGIWTLGQLGKAESLGVLEGLYTGEIPDREPLDEVISQFELKKAIALCNGGVNISRFVWYWWATN